jgi:hypothetical protein
MAVDLHGKATTARPYASAVAFFGAQIRPFG